MIRAFLTFLTSLFCVIFIVPTAYFVGVDKSFFGDDIWEGKMSEDLYEDGVAYLRDLTYDSDLAISNSLGKDRIDVLIRRNFDVDIVRELGRDFFDSLNGRKEEIIVSLEPIHRPFSQFIEDLAYDYYKSLPKCRISDVGAVESGLPDCVDADTEEVTVTEKVSSVLTKKVEKTFPSDITISSENAETFRLLSDEIRSLSVNLLLAVSVLLLFLAALTRYPRVWEMLFVGGTVLVVSGAVVFFSQKWVAGNLVGMFDFDAKYKIWGDALDVFVGYGLGEVAMIGGYLSLVGTVLIVGGMLFRNRK